LTANQYVLSNIIYERYFNTFEHYKFKFPKVVDKDLKYLTQENYIEKADSRIGYRVTKKFLDNVIKPDNFDELLSIYPVYVIRSGNNKDYLRTNKDTSKALYKKITSRKKSNHDFIIKCLKYEIETRTAEGSLQYMKKLPNWLKTKEWETWAERMEHEVKPITSKTYGTDLE
ncbi:MAG TPA: hypothetical protein VK982_02610, partial [Bacteroidales bacterium]|nr:hypothetical protein [Bacteroidales bacterium]